ncbi:methyltransferase domain-containing protein [Microbacterium protaetiae]|uniref:Methyltransferase domain-containing protein n=1 Tax=Microbacterium protaetiae TaxID=2509458 RepID=A0A4P6ECC9_9MICO|nr:methyltransferase [Microbacterium protaetiae]QAY59694.1 methyltransferase domain-containing protein [Microbacterium protaetiae]
MPHPEPLPEPDPALCRALAADLNAAGFRTDALREAWGADADGALGRGHALPIRRRLKDDDRPLAVIARLFGIGDAVPVVEASVAFASLGVSGLEALGLALRDGGMLRPLALVRPQAFIDEDAVGEWWVASDLDEAALGGPLPEDHVLGVGGASLTLAGLQLTTPVARALDLGCGCGIQSLCARRVAASVVATDVSERALRFTRLNALLNGVDEIRTRAGDMFAPVRGERFDRIVSNPPFVITPRVDGVPAYEYRDGGRVGDGLVAEFVAGVGAHLTPGGTAQLLANWETRDGVSGLDRVREWVVASGLDAWVIERELLDPVAYAELWIRDAGTLPGTAAFDELLGAWLDDFAARGVSEVGFGYILLRRPASGAPTLARYERMPQPVAEHGLGAHLARSLVAHDRLMGLDDAGLAASTLLTAGDVTEARHHLPGAPEPSVIELRQGGGFGRVIDVDPALAALVGACDGDLAVGPLIAAIAQLLEVDPAALRAELLPRVRELVFTGFLAFA